MTPDPGAAMIDLPQDPVASVLVAAMLFFIGWGGWKIFPALRRDWQRDRHLEEIEVTEAVKRLAHESLDEVRVELKQARDELRQAREDLRVAWSENHRLRSRVAALEQRECYLYRHIGAVETWAKDHIPADMLVGMPRLARDDWNDEP